MKIKEIAEKLQTTPRAIRYYEEKGLIAPNKDQVNDYRIFKEKDLYRLKMILSLRELGIPLDQIKEVLSKKEKEGILDVNSYLEEQRTVIFKEWLELREIIASLDQMIASSKEDNQISKEELYHLANHLKSMRQHRENWKDKWNFDDQAIDYDQTLAIEGTKFDVHANYHELLDYIVQQVNTNKIKVGLDIGIGTGNLAAMFLDKDVCMYGIDQSQMMLNKCNEKYPTIKTRRGNFLALPFVEERFDFIVTSYALHHLTDEQKLLAFQEMNRVLKPYGKIVIGDLMFENDTDRRQVLQTYIDEENTFAVDAIEDEYYADRSVLLKWFKDHNFETTCKKFNSYLHVIVAEKN